MLSQDYRPSVEQLAELCRRNQEESKTKRADIWLPLFDGLYRFAYPMTVIDELQTKIGRTFMQIYGRIAHGRYEAGSELLALAHEGQASREECIEAVRLGLIGGGAAVVDGEQVTIKPDRAKQLVANYLADAPAVDAWNIAFAAMSAAMYGRQVEPHEVDRPRKEVVWPIVAAADASGASGRD